MRRGHLDVVANHDLRGLWSYTSTGAIPRRGEVAEKITRTEVSEP